MSELAAYKEGIAEGIKQERKRMMVLLENASVFREFSYHNGSQIIYWDEKLRNQLEEKETKETFYPRVVPANIETTLDADGYATKIRITQPVVK